MACCGALLAANAAVMTARLGAGGSTADPAVVIVEETPDATVLIVAPDGSTISVDPSSGSGKQAIAEAEARGDTIVRTPADGSPSAVGDPSSPAAVRQSASELDAADGVVDGLVQVIDEKTGELVQRTVQQVQDALDLPDVTLPTTPEGPADRDDEPLVSVTTPRVVITTPDVEVTTPPVSVTTPPVSGTTPPVTVPTPVTTIAVPTTTVTVPTTTVTVPTVTVTVPSVTVTVPPVSVTVTTIGLGL
jgi:hypothetical protein